MFIKTLLFVSSLNSSLVSDSLPYRDSLFVSLRRFHVEQLQADLSEFDIKAPTTKKFEEVLKWMPQVGTSYNLLTDRLRPTIGYNFNQIYSNIKEKQKTQTEESLRNAKIQKIMRGSALAFKSDSFALVEKLNALESVKRTLKHLESVQMIEDEEFRLQEERNAKGEILPVNWVNIRLQHVKAGEAYWKELERLDLLILEIFKLARF